jgi:Family of unknown function (DUF6325)
MLEFPLEYALVVFPGNKFTGEIVPELLDLAQKEIVRFIDIVFIRKDADGSIRTIELNDIDEDSYRLFAPLGEHIDGFFTEDDLTWAASMQPENSSAALFLWENLWMRNIRNAIVASGGVLAERGQIPDEVVKEFMQRQAAESGN